MSASLTESVQPTRISNVASEIIHGWNATGPSICTACIVTMLTKGCINAAEHPSTRTPSVQAAPDSLSLKLLS